MAFNKFDDAFALMWAKRIKAIRLLGGKCKECGNSDIFCLDFHHFSDNKETTFYFLRQKRWSEIEKEIKKCKLLCKNCHTEFHCDPKGRCAENKKNFMISLNKLKCNKCGYVGKNFASLEFHHLRNKEFLISDFVHRKKRASVEDLNNELLKCEVLCSNCHQRERIDVNKFNKFKDIIEQKIIKYVEEQKINKNNIIDLYKKGYRVFQIVKELGYAKATVSTILTKYKNGLVPERLKGSDC